MSGNRDVIDWEHQLACIIDKSNKNLTKLSSEYGELKRRHDFKSHSRSVLYPPAPPLDNQACHFYNENDDTIQRHSCGPHQQAAMAAFHATKSGNKITRPISRSSEDDILRRLDTRTKQSVERMVNDKLTVTSRSVDALRDQIAVLADEVRALNQNASSTAQSLSSQERSVDLLRHDLDSRREFLLKMESYCLDENTWRKSVGSEITHLKQALAQQRQDISTKATSVDVNAGLESAKLETSMSMAAAISPLQTSIQDEIRVIMNDVSSWKESMDQKISEKMQPYHENIATTMRDAIKAEAKATEKRCQDMLERHLCGASTQGNAAPLNDSTSMKDELATENSTPYFHDKKSLDMITHIVIKTVSEVEENLRSEILQQIQQMKVETPKHKTPEQGITKSPKQDRVIRKQVEALQVDVLAMKKKIKDEIGTDMSSLKDDLKRAATRQLQFISKKKVDALVEACRADLSEQMGLVEKRLMTSVSNNKIENEIISMNDSLLEHKALLQNLRQDYEKLAVSSSKFLAEGDVRTIAKEEGKYLFQENIGCTNDLIDSRIKSIHDDLKKQVAMDSSNNDSGVAAKLKMTHALCESLNDGLEIIKELESRVDGISSKVEKDLKHLIDTVRSLDERVQALEKGHKSLYDEFASKDGLETTNMMELVMRNKSELEIAMRCIDESFGSELSSLRCEISNISNKLLEAQKNYADDSAQTYSLCESGMASERSLEKSISTLHCTLKEAKDLALNNDINEKSTSVISILANGIRDNVSDSSPTQNEDIDSGEGKSRNTESNGVLSSLTTSNVPCTYNLPSCSAVGNAEHSQLDAESNRQLHHINASLPPVNQTIEKKQMEAYSSIHEAPCESERENHSDQGDMLLSKSCISVESIEESILSAECSDGSTRKDSPRPPHLEAYPLVINRDPISETIGSNSDCHKSFIGSVLKCGDKNSVKPCDSHNSADDADSFEESSMRSSQRDDEESIVQYISQFDDDELSLGLSRPKKDSVSCSDSSSTAKSISSHIDSENSRQNEIIGQQPLDCVSEPENCADQRDASISESCISVESIEESIMSAEGYDNSTREESPRPPHLEAQPLTFNCDSMPETNGSDSTCHKSIIGNVLKCDNSPSDDTNMRASEEMKPRHSGTSAVDGLEDFSVISSKRDDIESISQYIRFDDDELSLGLSRPGKDAMLCNDSSAESISSTDSGNSHSSETEQYENSIPGSITSFDEAESVSTSLSIEDTQLKGRSSVNRDLKNGVYDVYDKLLVEIHNSGLVIRDSESIASGSSAGSYGSSGFESEDDNY